MTSGAKALRATTIIPDHLYVDRDADRQLEAIIDDMGRPGYVLVASNGSHGHLRPPRHPVGGGV